MDSAPIYLFYSELDDYEPKIWRRFQITGNTSLARLGYIIMTIFEMQASHTFGFRSPYRKNLMRDSISEGAEDYYSRLPETHYYYLEPESNDLYEEGTYRDAAKALTKHVLHRSADELFFDYDFGDGWQVNLILETVFEDTELPGKELPRVLEGEGFGIIEDCGGPGGLVQLRNAFTDKQGDDYEHYSAWLGVSELDLDRFDLEDMNFRLKKLPRIFADIYEKHRTPTQKSLDLLNRKYIKNVLPARERALEIVNQNNLGMFGTVDKNGDPFIKAMLCVAHDGLREFWFCSNTCSKLRDHILEHPNSCLYYHEGFDGVMLKGTAEISYEDEMRSRFWDDSMLYHYPKGPTDPDYMLIKFTASMGNFYRAKHNEDFDIE